MLKKTAIVLVLVTLLVAPATISTNPSDSTKHNGIYLLTVNPSEISGPASDMSFQALKKGLKEYSLYAVDMESLLTNAKTGSVPLEIRGKRFELVLAPDTRTLAPGATERPIHVFRGSVKGIPGSMATLIISDRAVFATVWVPGEWYYLRSTKTKLNGKLVVVGYSSRDRKHSDGVYHY